MKGPNQFYIILVFGIIIGFSIGSYVQFASSMSATYPPTPAFSKVYINSDEIKAKTFNDILNITTEGMITTEVSENENKVIMKLQEISCPILQGFNGIDENGNLVCGVI